MQYVKAISIKNEEMGEEMEKTKRGQIKQTYSF